MNSFFRFSATSLHAVALIIFVALAATALTGSPVWAVGLVAVTGILVSVIGIVSSRHANHWIGRATQVCAAVSRGDFEQRLVLVSAPKQLEALLGYPWPFPGRPPKHDLSTWTVTDDWPEHVPVTEAEVDVFEAWFGDLFDELFGSCR